MVVISPDRLIIYISYSHGARAHDISTLSRCGEPLKRKANLTVDDLILADSGFVGFQNHSSLASLKIISPYKKTKRRDLTKEEKDFNTRHSSVRTTIERVFATLKNKFAILAKPFRGPSYKQEEIFHVCATIYNLIRKMEIEIEERNERALNSIQTLLN